MLLVGTGPVFSATPAFTLQPYQMVRSLQLIQDRVANGDSAALPMQSNLLRMIDRRLRQADAKTFSTKRNFRALLIYAMSGGNPSTVREILAKTTLKGPQEALGRGIADYMDGRPAAALTALRDVDPLAQNPELGASIALVKGSLSAAANAAEALKSLDEARLLAPGTLIEEAALRRTVAITAQDGDSKRFLRASDQYVRRFLHSPYAGQFADSFVAGIVRLQPHVGIEAMKAVLADMDADHRRFLYLRLARASTIAGFIDLAAFAAKQAEPAGKNDPAGSDPRAALYSSIAAVTSGNVTTALGKLKAVDPETLSDGDRRLRDAALKVAQEITAHPDGTGSGLSVPLPHDAQPPPAPQAGAVAPETASVEATDTVVRDASKQLRSIDRLLQENPQ